MMNREDFIEQFVSIEYIEDETCYGFYPFQLIAISQDDKMDLNCLDLGGDVMSCYTRFKHYLNKGFPTIHMAVDFPASGDIDKDFVAIFSYENGRYEISAIPYDIKTGEQSYEVTSSMHLDNIFSEFLVVMNS